MEVDALEITVHRAARTNDTQTFGSQDPYCEAKLLGGPAKASGGAGGGVAALAAARTLPVEDGGTEPRWEAAHSNILVLPLGGGGWTDRGR